MNEIESFGSGRLSTCATCGAPASCLGAYEGHTEPSWACDDCCGHGNEDGWCRTLEELPELIAGYRAEIAALREAAAAEREAIVRYLRARADFKIAEYGDGGGARALCGGASAIEAGEHHAGNP